MKPASAEQIAALRARFQNCQIVDPCVDDDGRLHYRIVRTERAKKHRPIFRGERCNRPDPDDDGNATGNVERAIEGRQQ